MAAVHETSLLDYWQDTFERSILFLDVLRQRGNIFLQQSRASAPNVLKFDHELLRDGRSLDRPVNYMLLRIVPPAGTTIDPSKPPFIVVDPRAGQGPGIGGMKHDSEIGVALAAGHPCYFLAFLPEPVPGQTVEDVCRAEVAFIAEVAERHAQADGKPIVVGNCQAGWQVMMAAAMQPDLPGPILLAGSPLSYWAGTRGRSPMRYLGGLLGGTWMTALAGDAGHGLFDGANLVANFEQLNLANTFWKKNYNVFAHIDTEPPRFLDFETWWDSPIVLDAGEMQWIADNLFVGNRLSSGELRTSDGLEIDLRNIRSPIIVFCSWGDNITPPQQALDWILDLYDTTDEIVANGQTIVYTLNQSIGHLGIFVSGKVATKEHEELVNCMEMINLMPPGLYEAVITEVEPDTANPELIHGRYLFRLESRTLDDIRGLGFNSPEDDLRFATVARLSEVNLALYRLFLSPFVKTVSTEQTAELARRLHPNRFRFAFFSDENPAMHLVEQAAERVRQSGRHPAPDDNPFRVAEGQMSDAVETWLTLVGEARDTMEEAFFMNVYGSPLVQAAVGLHPGSGEARRRPARDLARELTSERHERNLLQDFERGGVEEAVLRALVYIQLPNRAADERSFSILERVRLSRPANRRRPLSELKEAMRTQFQLVRLDPDRALEAIPSLLPDDETSRREALDLIREIVTAGGEPGATARQRLQRIEGLFALEPANHPAKGRHIHV